MTFVKPQEGHPAFRLLREVARGGAGTLYEAEDPQLGRRVACKIFHRRAADSDAIRNEARRTTALAGPGVVRLLDADPDAGYIAYEWLPLGSVRDAIAREEATRLGPPDRWATPIAVALARVHRLGFVHGDVKPANILLAGWDLPLLADFGLTVPIGTAHLAGTPGYVSPERLAGAVASPRDDVHAFGRMLTEVIAASGQGTEAWLRLAAACSGPFDERPRDGDALVEALRRPG
ncbi:MAG: serine/threonine protein kinase [Deltaproteobacteria bacterium]|nr:serine/threonine protein kinase [Deltaproteobacteria bacterium]